jgi:DNA-binding HxlR family transcriptional regulator
MGEEHRFHKVIYHPRGWQRGGVLGGTSRSKRPNTEISTLTKGSLGSVLFGRRHALPILLYLYAVDSASTSEIIRDLGGHPKAIIDTLSALEAHGALVRSRQPTGRHAVVARLSVRGMHLVETAPYRWGRILRDWNDFR